MILAPCLIVTLSPKIAFELTKAYGSITHPSPKIAPSSTTAVL